MHDMLFHELTIKVVKIPRVRPGSTSGRGA
jgi:hypothetical protein